MFVRSNKVVFPFQLVPVKILIAAKKNKRHKTANPEINKSKRVFSEKQTFQSQ